MFDYETRRDMIVTHAWETWTKNGLQMDDEMRAETEKTVQDAVNNAYVEDMSDADWLTATLKLLGHVGRIIDRAQMEWEVRHDLNGFYLCSADEADYEDQGHASVGFDGRPHYSSAEDAWRTIAG